MAHLEFHVDDMLEFTSKNTPWQKEKLPFPWSYLHWKTSEFWRIWRKKIGLDICFTFTYHFFDVSANLHKNPADPIEITTKKNTSIKSKKVHPQSLTWNPKTPTSENPPVSGIIPC